MGKSSLVNLLSGLLALCLLRDSKAFVVSSRQTRTGPSSINIALSQSNNDHSSSRSKDVASSSSWSSSSRRAWIEQTMATAATVVTTLTASSQAAIAEDAAAIADAAVELPPMKNFVDPVGLFSIDVPKNFYTLRRSAKGDLPDEKTGTGRRGSSIFTAGNMAKAEVIAVERFPTRVLLEENGIEATGDLSTIPGVGESGTVATLINTRRDKDKPGGVSNTQLIPESIVLSDDKKELGFALRTEIDVQKPELLLEQYGVSRLFRITVAKASLRSNDGNVMAVFASALEQDFNGPDGLALQEAVNKFVVNDRSMLMEKK